MLTLIAGLVVFLGVHSIGMFKAEARSRFIAERGEITYKVLYSLVSVMGLVLIVIGYAQTRTAPMHVWMPPTWSAHLAALLMLFSFMLMAATYVPGNWLKAKVGHPMLLSVKIWAVAHLLANGRLGDIVLFTAFLTWAVASYAISRRRDRREGVNRLSSGGLGRSLVTIVAGIVGWVVFAFWLHLPLIGVSPMGA